MARLQEEQAQYAAQQRFAALPPEEQARLRNPKLMEMSEMAHMLLPRMALNAQVRAAEEADAKAKISDPKELYKALGEIKDRHDKEDVNILASASMIRGTTLSSADVNAAQSGSVPRPPG